MLSFTTDKLLKIKAPGDDKAKPLARLWARQRTGKNGKPWPFCIGNPMEEDQKDTAYSVTEFKGAPTLSCRPGADAAFEVLGELELKKTKTGDEYLVLAVGETPETETVFYIYEAKPLAPKPDAATPPPQSKPAKPASQAPKRKPWQKP